MADLKKQVEDYPMKQYDLVRTKARDKIKTDINDALELIQSVKGF